MNITTAPRSLLVAALLATGLFAMHSGLASNEAVRVPAPKLDPAVTAKQQVAVFAGGCFWGVEDVYEHVKGVKSVSSGYAGGSSATARYPVVSSGMTDHAEAVRIVYDPTQVSYGTLLQVYFSVAHDPTQLNRQGPDTGTQYRSTVFAGNADQARVANAYIAQINAAHAYPKPLVTTVETGKAFYPAEEHHQDYARLNPNDRYIVINDAPKVVHLKQVFPNLYRGG